MFPFHGLVDAIGAELIRAVTGKLFTDAQIRSVSSHAVGKYFADLLPERSDKKSARERVDEARDHIAKASIIISTMQEELSAQTEQLEMLLSEVENKKKLAEKYEVLAKTNQEQFAALRSEMESALRKELIAQSEKGKVLRQVASVILWLVALVGGAALGTYFKEVLAWLRALVA